MKNPTGRRVLADSFYPSASRIGTVRIYLRKSTSSGKHAAKLIKARLLLLSAMPGFFQQLLMPFKTKTAALPKTAPIVNPIAVAILYGGRFIQSGDCSARSDDRRQGARNVPPNRSLNPVRFTNLYNAENPFDLLFFQPN
ncbi:MAG TPA: hypothetical protein VIL74_20545 [Pyrinomonadaceae bacterium]|jgi:hypothetical protein